MGLLTNRLLVAVTVTIQFLIAQGIGRKLIRGSGWRVSDFAVGVDAFLTAISVAALRGFDLVRELQATTGAEARESIYGKLFVAFAVIVWMFFCHLIAVGIHQDWDNRHGHPEQGRWLLGTAIAGLTALALVIVAVQGG